MVFGRKTGSAEERLKAREAENRRLAEDLERLKKDYAELQKAHADHVARSMDLEILAASLNFQVHVLSRDRQTLEMREAALRSQNEQLQVLLRRAREEIEALKRRAKGPDPGEDLSGGNRAG